MFVKLSIPRENRDPMWEIYETPQVRFETRPWGANTMVSAHYACMIVDGKPYDALVPGVVFVMNDEGKTIEKWDPNWAPKD